MMRHSTLSSPVTTSEEQLAELCLALQAKLRETQSEAAVWKREALFGRAVGRERLAHLEYERDAAIASTEQMRVAIAHERAPPTLLTSKDPPRSIFAQRSIRVHIAKLTHAVREAQAAAIELVEGTTIAEVTTLRSRLQMSASEREGDDAAHHRVRNVDVSEDLAALERLCGSVDKLGSSLAAVRATIERKSPVDDVGACNNAGLSEPALRLDTVAKLAATKAAIAADIALARAELDALHKIITTKSEGGRDGPTQAVSKPRSPQASLVADDWGPVIIDHNDDEDAAGDVDDAVLSPVGKSVAAAAAYSAAVSAADGTQPSLLTSLLTTPPAAVNAKRRWRQVKLACHSGSVAALKMSAVAHNFEMLDHHKQAAAHSANDGHLPHHVAFSVLFEDHKDEEPER
tara:strand:+ start:535 stop:1743 length:1209 start_codon:yes stop_codon:yes gene_type:complete